MNYCWVVERKSRDLLEREASERWACGAEIERDGESSMAREKRACGLETWLNMLKMT